MVIDTLPAADFPDAPEEAPVPACDEDPAPPLEEDPVLP
jgi:hypothetical protein